MWHVYYKSHIISIWMTKMHRIYIYIYRTREANIIVKKEIFNINNRLLNFGCLWPFFITHVHSLYPIFFVPMFDRIFSLFWYMA